VKKKESYKLKIDIEELHFSCILGILEHERRNPQEIIVDATIEYDFKKNAFINYAEVAEFIKTVMQERKFFLIEDALRDVSMQLKNKFSKIDTLYLKITKPSILPDCKVSVSDTIHFKS